MEGQASGGAEVRRLHIVYFLSRKGRVESPHLIRVHHFCRNGVRLRDIKRWMGDLRGKDMPESFSWSYKRKYKTGYVWQDLLDDDLITPISDNEYVLKGSEIKSSTTTKDFSYIDNKIANQKAQSSPQEGQNTICKEENQSQTSESTSMYVSMKSSSEIEEESPTFCSDASTLTDDSGKLDRADKISSAIKHDQNQESEMKPSCRDAKTEHSSSSFYSSLLSGKRNKKRHSNKVTISDEKTPISSTETADPSKRTSSTSDDPHFAKSKSYSSTGASAIFKNLITCGTVDTNDMAVVATNKQNMPTNLCNLCSSDASNVHTAEICKRDRLGGSERVFGTPVWTQQHFSGRKSFDGVKDSIKNKSESRDQRVSCGVHKPVSGPLCSQCGKLFKPDKLHSHMKSCKGMKAALAKAAANVAISVAAAEKTSTPSTNVGSIPERLLAH